MIELKAGGVSDVGRVRAQNQDAWGVTSRLFAVADGMGGHKGGEVAAGLAIEVLLDRADEVTAKSLVRSVKLANEAVFSKAASSPDLRGMGTTLCAVALVGEGDDQEFAVINVGDSRCYVLLDGELVQVTRDHSLVEDMRAAGQITAEEAAVHPHRNIVTRALGIGRSVEVDEFVVVPGMGQRLLLCSDGLFNEVAAPQIIDVLTTVTDPEAAATELVRQANENGGRDNVTCLIVDVINDDGIGARAAAEGLEIIRPRRSRNPSNRLRAATTRPKPESDAETPEPPARHERKRRGKRAGNGGASPARVRRFTWRTAAFAVVFAAIIAAAIGAVVWYARGSYFVQADTSGELVVFKGRPGGVLGFDPTVVKRTGIAKSQVPEMYRDALADGKQFAAIHGADEYLAEVRMMICSDLRNGATPPTLPPHAPPTTIPDSCAKEIAGKKRAATTSTTQAKKPSSTRPAQPTTTAVGSPTTRPSR